MFEMNRHHSYTKQNRRHQAGSDQSRKQMRHASPGLVTFHDTAKLFPRPGAAIEFHYRTRLYDRNHGPQANH
jgi:hypothetical protein